MKRRFTLKKIQILGVSALVVLIAIIGVGALYSASGVDRAFHSATALNRNIQDVDQLLFHLASIRGDITSSLLEKRQDLSTIAGRLTALTKKAGSLSSSATDPVTKTLAEKLLADSRTYRETITVFVENAESLEMQSGGFLSDSTLTDIEKKTYQSGNKLKRHLQQRITVVEQRVLAESNRFRRMGILATLGGVLVVVVVMFLLRSAINRPVKDIIAAAQAVTDGDLSSTIGDDSADNFGIISRAIDDMNASLRTSVGGLRHISGDVRDVSRDIEKYSLDVVRGAGQQLDGVEDVSAGVEKMNECADATGNRLADLINSLQDTTASTMEMASAISDVSNFANYTEKEVTGITESQLKVVDGLDGLVEVFTGITTSAREMEGTSDKLTESSQEVGQTAQQSIKLADAVVRLATEEGGAAVSNMIDVSQRNAELAEQYATVIQSLGEKSKSIGRILDVIRDVADNTALLSLNAAIISAQAGEHGRSFSVVAEEIRELARATTSNVQEIEDVVESVVGEVDRAVTLIDELTSGATQGVTSAEKTKTFLGTIADHSARSADMAREISNKAEDQVSRSQRIRQEITGNLTNVEQVNKMVQEQKGNSSLIVDSTQKLTEIANTLREGTDRLNDSSSSISRMIAETHIFAKKTETVLAEEREVSSNILDSVYTIAEVTEGNMNLMQWMGVAISRLKDLVDRLLPEVDHFQVEHGEEYIPPPADDSFDQGDTPEALRSVAEPDFGKEGQEDIDKSEEG